MELALINHPEIMFFYCSCGLLCVYIFHWRMKLEKWKSFVSALCFVFVGSEYYEIPLFIQGYLLGPTPDYIHHIFITIMFLILLGMLETKMARINILCFVAGPMLTGPILYIFPKYIYYARVIGFFFLFLAVTTSSEGVGGKTVSKKP